MVLRSMFYQFFILTSFLLDFTLLLIMLAIPLLSPAFRSYYALLSLARSCFYVSIFRVLFGPKVLSPLQLSKLGLLYFS